MSWVLIAVIALFAIFGFIGWKKGIIKIVVSLATLIITILVSVVIAPVVCTVLQRTTQLDDNFQKLVYEVLMKYNYNDSANGTSNSAGEDDADFKDIAAMEEHKDDIDRYMEQLSGNAVTVSKYAQQVVEKLDVPDNVRKQMQDIVSEQSIRNMIANNDIVKIVHQTDGSIKSIMLSVVALKLANIIFRTIVYIVVFIIVFIALKIVVGMSNLISRLPLIKQANKLVGLAIGLLEGLIAVWLMFVVITACASMGWAAAALAEISANPLLAFLYESDMILRFIFSI